MLILFQACLSQVYSNHSIRVTCVTMLDEQGFDARHIMRVTGHRNEASMRSYSSRLNDNKKRKISDCLTSSMTTVLNPKLSTDQVTQTFILVCNIIFNIIKIFLVNF